MSAPSLPSTGRHAQCHVCSLVVALPAEGVETAGLETAAEDLHFSCPRCAAQVHRRKPDSLSRTWAFLVAAMICYIPANLYPIMTSSSLGTAQSDTILSGVIFLFLHGMWPLAVIVFVASVVVPVLKIAILIGLALSVQLKSQWHPRRRALLYRIVEAIGRWSMVDVYVVTILVALVHLGSIASVEAERGSLFFGAVVVLTILAAESFDPRLIWDQIEASSE